MRVMVGTPAVVRIYIDDEDGQLISVDDATTVDVVVADGAGVQIAVGEALPDDQNVGVYRYILLPQDKLDVLTVTATATVGGVVRTISEIVSVVGTRIVPKWRLAQDAVCGGLSPANLEFVLGAVEDLLRQTLGFPATWESARLNFDENRGISGAYNPVTGLSFATGGERLLVPGVSYPQKVYALTTNGEATLDADLVNIRPGNGVLIWSQGRSWPSGNYQMWLAHGMDIVPGDLVEAAFALCRYGAKKIPRQSKDNNSNMLNERASQITTEGATILFSLPTLDRPTGLPEVDSVIVRYRDVSVI